MPKVLFWNIARAGGGVGEVVDSLRSDLEGLASKKKPDVIVLCEGSKGLRGNLVGNNVIPTGYTAPKTIKTHGGYKKDTTLRYVLMHRTNLPCSGYLIGTGNSRPALAICFSGICVIALHAPSISGSITKQTTQMLTAYNAVTNLIQQNNLPGVVNPVRMIFGDLNMNLRDQQKPGGIRGKFANTSLQTFSITDPGVGTHRNANTGIYDTTLDWALTAPGVNATVKVVEADPEDEEMDWYGEDEDFEVKFDNQKDPDHWPILIEW